MTAQEFKPYEIEPLLDRRGEAGNENAKNLVKWKDCGMQHNAWYPVHAVAKSRELMAECDARLAADPTRKRRQQKAIKAPHDKTLLLLLQLSLHQNDEVVHPSIRYRLLKQLLRSLFNRGDEVDQKGRKLLFLLRCQLRKSLILARQRRIRSTSLPKQPRHSN